MLKDILVPITGALGDDNALQAALALAESKGAHLAVLVTVRLPTPPPIEWGFYPTELYTGALDHARAEGKRAADRLRAETAKAAAVVDVRLVEAAALSVERVAALHARHADLTVMTGPAARAPMHALDSWFAELLRDTGRPLLVIPPEYKACAAFQHAVIAWKPTREASRAVHDALPLLRMANTIDVVMIDPNVSDGAHGAQPGADIAAHLARHGLKVQVVSLPDHGRTEADAILQYAGQSGAGLLVAGGYGHSRFREQLLGGVTRALWMRATLPVLFSH